MRKPRGGISRAVDGSSLSGAVPFISSLHISKTTHSGCTLCWPASHIPIILRAGTASAAGPADDFLPELVTPVKLGLRRSAFLLRSHRLSSPAFGRSNHEPPSSFLSSLQHSLFFPFHSPNANFIPACNYSPVPKLSLSLFCLPLLLLFLSFV